jgi:hypothetical protein
LQGDGPKYWLLCQFCCSAVGLIMALLEHEDDADRFLLSGVKRT